jgi:hypothetical protein
MIDLTLALSLSGRPLYESVRLWIDAGAPGWVTNGHFMAFIGDAQSPLVGDRGGVPLTNMAPLLSRYRACPLTPMRERPELLTPRVMKPCDACKGRGWKTETRYRPNGNGPHKKVRARVDCYECEGDKEFVEDVGQVVFEDAAGEQTVVSPHYATLLSGLSVFRVEDDKDRRGIWGRCLAGLDASGLWLVVLMPMRTDGVRAREASRPTEAQPMTATVEQ